MATNDASGDTTSAEPVLFGSRTHDHLRAGFAAESQTHAILSAFALLAEIEGDAATAALLRDLAEAHALHAHGHLDLLRRAAEPLSGLPIGTTRQNLQCAATAARLAATELYPDMVKTAEAEGFLDIADWLRTVARAVESHADRLGTTAPRSSGEPR